MKLAVIGSRGQLGRELCRKGHRRGLEVIALDLPDFDITDQQRVEEKLSVKDISLVINAAAYTAVDQAEIEREKAFAVNAEAPMFLALSCSSRGIPLIHISTDYVFNGQKWMPYLETDSVNPINVYGESKAAGERAVQGVLETHIILRTSWLYSSHGKNFVKTIIRLASEREELSVVCDQYGCPTHAADLAEAVLAIAVQIYERRSILWGTYHYCGKGVTTWSEFAQKTCEISKGYVPLRLKHVKAISTAEYPTPAKRPPYSALDCAKVEETFGLVRKPWQDSLSEMLAGVFS